MTQTLAELQTVIVALTVMATPFVLTALAVLALIGAVRFVGQRVQADTELRAERARAASRVARREAARAAVRAL